MATPSIAMIPSGYKDGKVYSVLPNSSDGDFNFTRGSAATRVNAQGLVENVQIISPELVSNGNFSQIGTEEVLNGNFSQEGSELVTNGDFSVDSNWNKGTGWSISGGKASCDGSQTSNSLFFQNIGSLANKTVKFSFTLSNYVSGQINTAFFSASGTASYVASANGDYTFYIDVASGHNGNTGFTADSDFIGSIDNVSVKEVAQNWDLVSGATIGDNKAIITGDGSVAGLIEQTSVFASGKTYKITLDAVINSGGGLNVKYGLGFADNIGSVLTTGSYTFYYTASATKSLVIARKTGGVAYDSSITNISVKEVGQDWSLGSGWSIGEDKVIFNDASSGDIRTSSNIFTSSKKYQIKLTVGDLTSGTAFFGIGDGNAANLVTYDNYSNGDYTFEVVAPSGLDLRIYATTSSGSSFSITNLSIKEITDDTDIPRLDYSDGSCPSLLLEPQSTNLITYSEDFSQSYWTKAGASLSSSFASPSGDLSAFKLVEDTSTGVHGLTVDVSGLTIGNAHTISVYAKAGENNYMYMRFRYAGNTNVMFDLINGTIGVSGSNVLSKSIEPMTNGYYKCTITALAPSSAEGLRIYNSTNGTDISYTGNGTSGIYIWGAQVEAQSYATSYIPTNGSIATRLADVANNSGNSTLINSTEGVLYFEGSALANDGTNRYLTLTNGTSNERVALLFSANTNELRAIIFSSTQSINISFTTSSVDVLDYNKLAIRYKSGGYAFYVNGNLIGTNTSSSIFTSNTLNELSFDVGSGSLPFYGKTKALVVYKEALTDEQLQELTTI